MKQINITFFAIGLAILLWTSIASLSGYLAKEPTRRFMHKDHPESSGTLLKSSKNLEQLEKAYLDNPDSLDHGVFYANALFEKGITDGNAESLKKSVGLYNEILEKDPDNPDALLGLATLSLHVGVSEKAIEYYSLYLKSFPDDKETLANLALAEARDGQFDVALKRVNNLLEADQNFVIAIVTKGLIFAEKGEIDKARDLWEKAKSLETSPILQERIKSLINNSYNTIPDIESSASNIPPKGIETFFKSHDIIGPKFSSLKKIDQDTLVLFLNDFPVESMPPFAKEKFENTIKEQLKAYPENLLIIYDAQSNKELMTIGIN